MASGSNLQTATAQGLADFEAWEHAHREAEERTHSEANKRDHCKSSQSNYSVLLKLYENQLIKWKYISI